MLCYAKSLQSCPTLCDPIDGSPPGSPVPGILQARTLEWGAISFSNAWKWKVKVKSLSRVRLLATPWTTAYQAPPSMGFSRQEYWSGVPLPSPKGKHMWGKFQMNPRTSFQESFPVQSHRHAWCLQQQVVTIHMKYCLPRKLIRYQCPGILLGTGHVGILYPAYTKLPDSQKESRCSV